MSLQGTDLALLSARVGVARIGAFRLGFAPDDVEGSGTVGPGEYAWQEIKPEDDGQEWELMTPWTMCGGKSAITGGGGIAASFTDAPDPAFVGQTVQFTDTSTPANEITFWHWEFGDGAQSDEQNPTHQYAQPGTYPVTLWISSPRGSASATGTVTVIVGKRLMVVGGLYWHNDSAIGFSGFNGYGALNDTRFRDDSRRTLAAMVEWLTGKSSGASVLICTLGVTPNAGVGVDYGNQFQDALIAAGHTVTATGSLSSWAGFEPLDYDLLVCGPSLSAFAYHGLATAQGKVDYVLANGGSILSETGGTGGVWEAYGMSNTGSSSHPTPLTAHLATYGPTNWRHQRPFYFAPFGRPPVGGSWSTDYWALVMYTTMRVRAGTNTKGGQVAYAACALADTFNGDDHVPPETNVLGVWWG